MNTRIGKTTSRNRPAMYLRQEFATWLAGRYGLDSAMLEQMLPPVVMRSRYSKLAQELGLPLSSKSLANLDSKGEGPTRLV
jgi:hypothetical protein